MKRLVQLLQIPEIGSLPVMNCVFSELSGAFKDFNCSIRIVKNLSEIEDGGIIFMDDAAGNYRNNRSLYDRIALLCPTSVFICWYWRDLTFRPFNKMIHTGEYFMNMMSGLSDYAYMTSPSFVPLKLRANDPPSMIGMYPRSLKRDYCFMGGGYKMDWIPSEFTGIYHQVIWNNYLSYDERRAIYLSSMFALGFQSDENIRTGHLSQRLFEGLAYGCIVLCENPLAAEFTNGAIVHVTSKEDLVQKMQFYKENPLLVEEKQKQGYEWVKQYGTNRITSALFLDKIKTDFHEEFGETSKESVKNEIVCVSVSGGLGNQLFQLAAAYAYAKKENAQLQIIHTTTNGNRPLYWDTLLQSMKPYLVQGAPATLQHWQESCATQYKEIGPLTPAGIFLHGYMQTSKYFYNDVIKKEIRSLFTPILPPEIASSYRHLISNKQHVVVIHARRTDYLKNQDIIHFHGPLNGAYYKNAVAKMLILVPNPIFLLCGDDNHFWQEIKEDISEVYKRPYVVLEGESDIATFALLQQFPNVIMSNSTFIWWTTWLSNAKNVIAPSKWFGPTGLKHYEDIYEADWIRM